MDAWNAPQWTDFTSSPLPPCDDYFDQEHCEHEPKFEGLDPATASEVSGLASTPVRIISNAWKKDAEVVKEISYNDVLSLAMNNLKLSVKKKSFKSKSSVTPKSSENPTVSTSSRVRIDSSFGHVEPSRMSDRKSPKIDSKSIDLKSPKLEPISPMAKSTSVSPDGKLSKSPRNLPHSSVRDSVADPQPNRRISSSPARSSPRTEDEREETQRHPSSNVATEFLDDASLASGDRKSGSSKSHQPRYSTCQYRRRSLAKYRRRSNRYVSLAEAIAKFQNGTPERFRSQRNKNANSKRPALKTTLKITVPEPFQLSGNERSHQKAESAEVPRRKPKRDVTVPVVVPTSNSTITVKETKILHFGIPVRGESKKMTQIEPFSFEARNRELQRKKEEKLKQLQETKQAKAEFRAKPVPPAMVKPSAIKCADRSTKPCPFSFEQRDKLAVKKKEEMIKHALEQDKKARRFHAQPAPEFGPVVVKGALKENLSSDQNIQNAKNRMSVLPNVGSKTNLSIKRSSSNLENKRPNANSVIAVSTAAKSMVGDDAKKERRVSTALNTDKRAKERREFDEKIRRKVHEEETRRAKEESERLARRKAEAAELRKMAEVKARPMPIFRQRVLAHSSKPLTDPKSPAWAAKSTKKHEPSHE